MQVSNPAHQLLWSKGVGCPINVSERRTLSLFTIKYFLMERTKYERAIAILELDIERLHRIIQQLIKK